MLKKTPLSLAIGLALWVGFGGVAWANEPKLLKRATPSTPVLPVAKSSQQPTPNSIPNPSLIPSHEPTALTLSNTSPTPITLSDKVELDQTLVLSQKNSPTLTTQQSQPIVGQTAFDDPLIPPAQLTHKQSKTLIPKASNAKKYAPPKTAQSLASLSQFYQPAHAKQGRTCQGVWRYPHPIVMDDRLVALANYGYYNAKDYAELSGDVVVNQYGRQVRAGKLSLNPITNQASATGQVLFGSNPSLPNSTLMGVAGRLDYNTQTGQLSAQDVAFASSELLAHGHAQALSTPTANSYLMEQAMFSTCPPDDRVWHLRADQIHLDKDTGRGIAKNTTLAIKNVPIFYLPYFNFPIDDRRATGFLLPHVGLNSNDGLQISTPYYLNLAPNYDATITPTIYTNRHPKIGAEFRYLTDFGRGRLDGAYLPKDKQYNNNDRSHLFFEHHWQARDNLALFAHYRHVSDSRYLSDFDNLGLENNTLNLSRAVGASYYNDHLTAHLKAETYQKLDGTDRFGNPIADKDRPYARLPQLSLQYRLPNYWLPSVHVDWLNHSAYFKKSIKDNSETEKSGVRIYNELTTSRDFVRSWGYFSPKVALAHLYTSYDEDSLAGQNLAQSDGTYAVLVPKVVLDGGLTLEKQGSPLAGVFGQKGGYQVLSPRLKYLYSPYKDQQAMPNFETAAATPSYDQLLADSWFLGYDRISDLHAITPALAYRYVDKLGNTRFEAGIADQFYLDDIRVGLGDTVHFSPSHSGVSWQASVRPYASVWFKTAGSLTDKNRLATITGSLHYTPTPDTLFNVGVVKRKADTRFGQLPLHALTASTMLPIGDHWQLASATQYDIKNRQFMDTLIGLTYENCCVGVSVYGRQYKNELNPSDDYHRAIMAELRLTGLTGKGRLGKLLSEKVLGADKVSW